MKIMSQKLKPTLSEISNTDYICIVDGSGEMIDELYNFIRVPELDNMWVSEYDFNRSRRANFVFPKKDVYDDREVQDILYGEMKRRADAYKYDEGSIMSIMNADGRQIAYFY